MPDDSPAIITAHELEVRYNEQVVLNKASITIGARDRLGMVGRNGAGKSTLLRILAHQQEPDKGTLTRKRDLIVGYLPQNFTLNPEQSIEENIRQGARHVTSLIQQFESLDGNSRQHGLIEERIHTLDGWTLENRIETAMSRLNVPDRNRDISSLSGGEQRRVALCRAIVSQPDLLILDEPTNHLDPDSIDWMAGFLKSFPGAFLLVTHDRWFLNTVCTSIVEIANGLGYAYPNSSYEDYLAAKSERQTAEDQADRKRLAFIRRELDWVRRGPKARTTKSKSRLDRFDQAVATGAPEAELDIELVIPPPPKLGNRVVELRSVSLELGGNTLFNNFNFSFENKMRVGIAGRNGLGKTSLLKVILGQLQPTRGTVITGPLTVFNYVDQGRIQLNDEHTVLEEMSDGTEFVLFGETRLSLRAYLKRFLFTDDRIITKVRCLSGGERSRLLLARILKQGGNFLILDEPTNDLDLATLRILEETLSAFTGAVLVVSHDRYFLNRVCNGILAFEGNGVISYTPGNYDYYLEKRNQQLQGLAAAAKTRTPGSSLPSKPETRGPKKLTWKENQELEGMEVTIQTAETEVQRLENIFASPGFHSQHGHQTAELTRQLEAARTAVTRLYQRWEELDSLK